MFSPSSAESSMKKLAMSTQPEAEEGSSDIEGKCSLAHLSQVSTRLMMLECVERIAREVDPYGTLNIAPSQLISLSGFGLNYDKETPLRAIDYGGPDQQLKCVRMAFK